MSNYRERREAGHYEPLSHSLREADQDLAAGETYSAEEVLAELEQDEDES